MVLELLGKETTASGGIASGCSASGVALSRGEGVW